MGPHASAGPWPVPVPTALAALQGLRLRWEQTQTLYPLLPPQTAQASLTGPGLACRLGSRGGGKGHEHTDVDGVYFQAHLHLPEAAGSAGAHTLGSANTFQPSSWPILTRAAVTPMYTQAAAPIP